MKIKLKVQFVLNEFTLTRAGNGTETNLRHLINSGIHEFQFQLQFWIQARFIKLSGRLSFISVPVSITVIVVGFPASLHSAIIQTASIRSSSYWIRFIFLLSCWFMTGIHYSFIPFILSFYLARNNSLINQSSNVMRWKQTKQRWDWRPVEITV